MPGDGRWANGARWYRCDLWEYERYEDSGLTVQTLRRRASYTYRGPAQTNWERGDRGVECLLYLEDRKVTRSLRGAGPAAFPAG